MVDFDRFWLSKPHQKQSQSTLRVTVHLLKDKDSEILYFFHAFNTTDEVPRYLMKGWIVFIILFDSFATIFDHFSLENN